jgi:hypothetical protein
VAYKKPDPKDPMKSFPDADSMQKEAKRRAAKKKVVKPSWPPTADMYKD